MRQNLKMDIDSNYSYEIYWNFFGKSLEASKVKRWKKFDSNFFSQSFLRLEKHIA